MNQHELGRISHARCSASSLTAAVCQLKNHSPVALSNPAPTHREVHQQAGGGGPGQAQHLLLGREEGRRRAGTKHTVGLVLQPVCILCPLPPSADTRGRGKAGHRSPHYCKRSGTARTCSPPATSSGPSAPPNAFTPPTSTCGRAASRMMQHTSWQCCASLQRAQPHTKTWQQKQAHTAGTPQTGAPCPADLQPN